MEDIKENQEEIRFGNFIVKAGDDGIPFYTIKTVEPQIEWKVYVDTFLFKIIDHYVADKTEENKEKVKGYLTIIFYTCTSSDAHLMGILWAYVCSVSENIEAGDDIDITQAKAAYHVKKMLTDMLPKDLK